MFSWALRNPGLRWTVFYLTWWQTNATFMSDAETTCKTQCICQRYQMILGKYCYSIWWQIRYLPGIIGKKGKWFTVIINVWELGPHLVIGDHFLHKYKWWKYI